MAELKQHLSDLSTPLVTDGSAKMGVGEFEENAQIMEGPKADLFGLGTFSRTSEKKEVVGLGVAKNDKPEMPSGLAQGGMEKDIVGLGAYRREPKQQQVQYVVAQPMAGQPVQTVVTGAAPEGRKGLMEMTPEELQAKFANVQKLAQKGAGIIEKGAEALGALKEARQKKVLREVLGQTGVEIVPKQPSIWERILPKKKEAPKVLEEMGIETV